MMSSYHTFYCGRFHSGYNFEICCSHSVLLYKRFSAISFRASDYLVTHEKQLGNCSLLGTDAWYILADQLILGGQCFVGNFLTQGRCTVSPLLWISLKHFWHEGSPLFPGGLRTCACFSGTKESSHGVHVIMLNRIGLVGNFRRGGSESALLSCWRRECDKP